MKMVNHKYLHMKNSNKKIKIIVPLLNERVPALKNSLNFLISASTAATITIRGSKFGFSQSRIHCISQILIPRSSTERHEIRGEDIRKRTWNSETKGEPTLRHLTIFQCAIVCSIRWYHPNKLLHFLVSIWNIRNFLALRNTHRLIAKGISELLEQQQLKG